MRERYGDGFGTAVYRVHGQKGVSLGRKCAYTALVSSLATGFDPLRLVLVKANNVIVVAAAAAAAAPAAVVFGFVVVVVASASCSDLQGCSQCQFLVHPHVAS